jgi:hypothetical protein
MAVELALGDYNDLRKRMRGLQNPVALVDRPPWRRVAVLVGVALATAVLFALIDMLTGDLRGGRAFVPAAPGGSAELWPRVSFLLIVLPVVGGIAGALLPLYRYRWGGAALGLLVYALLIGAMILLSALTGADTGFGSVVLWGAGRSSTWQHIAVLGTLAVMSAQLGAMLRPTVLGASRARASVAPLNSRGHR